LEAPFVAAFAAPFVAAVAPLAVALPLAAAGEGAPAAVAASATPPSRFLRSGARGGDFSC